MPQGLTMILFYGLIFGAMYFILIRPQKKQQKKTQDMLNEIKSGDSVITIGGLHGVVDEVDTTKQTVTLDCEGIFLTFEKRAISRVVKASTVSTDAGTIEADEIVQEIEETNE
ncbi:preprotein translocase subunit YajC [Jeotgalibaca sp. PTS2502]|uniref:preprotein translocase subunit YajC n=1 Tax=Jeotgalibaca sp. PTS2502 TaxID=1903686 RepID=UPI0009736552|nr:preprotein translocase subunit YajC [Jeotgalibaca sp. PTS2502]APZ48930.1 preprotein translocase subunit YajC [Jeotgalibaca sp. PTS2502]